MMWGWNHNTADEAAFGGSSKRRAKVYRNPPAIDLYIGEKDAWKKFIATAEKSDRIKSIDKKSKKWDDKLEKIPPRKP